MKIVSDKIPLEFTMLADFYTWANTKAHKEFSLELFTVLGRIDGKPHNSNATYLQIASALHSVLDWNVYFQFYRSKNPFYGRSVISHASNGCIINYNTRFHSVKTFEFRDWLGNFYHEATHMADQKSALSFDHKNQDDKKAAPFEVQRIALAVFDTDPKRWL